MKTSERTIAAGEKAEENFEKGDLSLDPFAVDIFGKEGAAETEKMPINPAIAAAGEGRTNQPQSAAWFNGLPGVSRREAEFSNSILELSPDLPVRAAKKIEETIAYYTLRPPEDVSCRMISASEVNLTEAVHQLAKGSQIFLNFSCQSNHSPALMALNVEFAASIINSVLVGDVGVFALRELSAIERTIIEFLGINILGEVNNLLNQNLFCLQSISTEAPAPFEGGERGAEIVIGIDFGTFGGAVSLFTSRRFLAALNAMPRDGSPDKPAGKNFLPTLERFVPKLNLYALIGTTRLSGADLSYLETDDIIIIDQPEIEWRSASFQGGLRLYPGSGKNFRLDGNIIENGNGAELKLKIEEISVGAQSAAPAAMRMQMNETENNLAEMETGEPTPETEQLAAGEIAPENPSVLENVLVTLRVELGASKISLRELQALRAGQIISLGCRPTDPVRVVTDGGDQPVATGELIEIEGQLGVRLTKIFI